MSVHLHELLLKAARFEVNRRRLALPHLRGNDFDDLAMQSADDALVAVLSKLGELSRRKQVHDMGVQVRPDWKRPSRYDGGRGKAASCRCNPRRGHSSRQGDRCLRPARSKASLFEALHTAISTELTPHQREVLVATTVNGVPIDVLAERLNSTRGALYKTLHDARQQLRVYLAAHGMTIGEGEGGDMTPRGDDALLRSRLWLKGPELSCEECFEELDRYVELELAGRECGRGDSGYARAPRGMPRLSRRPCQPSKLREQRSFGMGRSASRPLASDRGSQSGSLRNDPPALPAHDRDRDARPIGPLGRG